MKINWFKINDEILVENVRVVIHFITKGCSSLNINMKYNDLLIYLKQGYWCKDCDKEFDLCNCNGTIEYKDINLKILKFIKHNFSFIMKNKLLFNIKWNMSGHYEYLKRELDELYEN